MERQEILNTLTDIIKHDVYCIYDDTEITEETTINDLHLDDIDCVEIEIELEIHLNLPNESCDCFVSNSKTIKDVIDKLYDLINK